MKVKKFHNKLFLGKIIFHCEGSRWHQNPTWVFVPSAAVLPHQTGLASRMTTSRLTLLSIQQKYQVDMSNNKKTTKTYQKESKFLPSAMLNFQAANHRKPDSKVAVFLCLLKRASRAVTFAPRWCHRWSREMRTKEPMQM